MKNFVYLSMLIILSFQSCIKDDSEVLIEPEINMPGVNFNTTDYSFDELFKQVRQLNISSIDGVLHFGSVEDYSEYYNIINSGQLSIEEMDQIEDYLNFISYRRSFELIKKELLKSISKAEYLAVVSNYSDIVHFDGTTIEPKNIAQIAITDMEGYFAVDGRYYLIQEDRQLTAYDGSMESLKGMEDLRESSGNILVWPMLSEQVALRCSKSRWVEYFDDAIFPAKRALKVKISESHISFYDTRECDYEQEYLCPLVKFSQATYIFESFRDDVFALFDVWSHATVPMDGFLVWRETSNHVRGKVFPRRTADQIYFSTSTENYNPGLSAEFGYGEIDRNTSAIEDCESHFISDNSLMDVCVECQ